MKIMFYALRPFDEQAYCEPYSKQYCRFVKHVGRYSNEGKGWASNTVKGA